MLNWVLAVVIGVVIGGVGAAVFGRRYASARWMAPVLAVVGTLIAAGLGGALGHGGYGWKKASLQVVLALVGVAAAVVLARRSDQVKQPANPAG
jgi:uncharacterized membrane protein YeaQ/YmgE (transglycosylase-associated protein family)